MAPCSLLPIPKTEITCSSFAKSQYFLSQFKSILITDQFVPILFQFRSTLQYKFKLKEKISIFHTVKSL